MQEQSQLSDAQLMARIASQDKGAFERLLDLHLTGIRSYLQRLTKDPSLAEDLAQETFLRVWQNAQQYQPANGALSTWLYRIAHNQFLDHIKSAGQKLDQALRTEQDVAELTGAAPSLEQQLDSDQTLTWLNAALTKLPLNQRSVLSLRYLQNQTTEQVATVLGLSSQAVESLAARARKQLKQGLSKWQGPNNLTRTTNGETSQS